MPYATPAQFKQRIALDHKALFQNDQGQYIDAVITRFLTEASATMDAWAGVTPKAEKIPVAYRGWCCEIAVYLAMQTSAQADEWIQDRYKDIKHSIMQMGKRGDLISDTKTVGGKTVKTSDSDWSKGRPGRFSKRF